MPGPPSAGYGSGEAERRQLTVLFCDLVGSTALAAALDPEDLREVISAYHRRVAEVVRRWSGHIAKYMGDGVLAYFGYPKAHEDAAERAVRAGLELVQAVGELKPHGEVALQVRVGIATGLVVAGDLIGEGAAQGEVVGETPNLAARLQALAGPGTVVIGPNTRRLLGGLFECADLGAHELRGLAKPVRAWRVLGPGQAEGRFEARQQAATGATPLVGREQELALLLDRWALARDGEGQVVLLQGEPGIGKSRLVEALRERLGGEPHTRLSYHCSPYHVTSPLHAVIDQLERAAGFHRDDTAEAKLAKLEALLRRAGADPAADAAPLLAALLAIPTGDRYPPLDLTPQRQRAKTLEALLAQLVGLAAERPVLVVLEDAHWSDPTTRELFDLAIERARELPMLVVITFRPEFQPPWAGHGHVTALNLNRLSRRQGAAMVGQVAGERALPAEVLEQIVAKTDGVPLFVEELTKAVLESGLLKEEADRYALAGPLPPLAIPATLHDSLLARLDRLASAKEVAQIGAALGREFSYELLAAVAPLDDARLRDALDQLASAELIFRRGSPPEATYTFKHALVRDAAHDSLLKSKRQRIHGRIAKALEADFPMMVEAEPETVAQHYAEAGEAERAVDYWLKAGQRAAGRWNNKEAVDHLTKGLKLLKTMPDTPARAQKELDFQITLGPALMTLKGFGSSEVECTYKRAYELCQQLRLDQSQQLLRVLYGLRRVYTHRGALQRSREVSEQMLRLAEHLHDSPMLLEAHYSLGFTLLLRGELISAQAHLNQGSVLGEHPAYAAAAPGTMGVKVGPICRAFLAWLLWARGYPNQARQMNHVALASVQDQSHRFTTEHVLFQFASTCQYYRDVSVTYERAETAIASALEHGFPQWAAWMTILRGWALAEQGRREEGIAQMRQGLAAASAIGSVLHRPYHLALLAEAYGGAGQVEKGLQIMDEAVALAEATGERFNEAELYRVRGELLLLSSVDKSTEAEACFHRALDIARGQEAKSWELRAATSLARLWRDQGRRAEARDLLAPIYGWFTEGFDTPDLKDAKALLDDLR